MKEVGRFFLGIMILALAALSFYVLKGGFSIAFLLFGLICLVIGLRTIWKALRKDNKNKDKKSKPDRVESGGSGWDL